MPVPFGIFCFWKIRIVGPPARWWDCSIREHFLRQHIEHTLQLRAGTVKLMLMDEERRFSANFFNCLAAAKDRIFSTNTGFLDRTGNEFRCSCEAGPMLPKQGQRCSAWIKAYEQRNVFISAAAGLLSVAQVGKVQFCACVFAR